MLKTNRKKKRHTHKKNPKKRENKTKQKKRDENGEFYLRVPLSKLGVKKKKQ